MAPRNRAICGRNNTLQKMQKKKQCGKKRGEGRYFSSRDGKNAERYPEATHLAHRICGKLGVLNEGRRCGRERGGEGEEGK